MRLRTTICALLLLSAACVARADDKDDPDTHVLTDDNFESFVSADLSLVEFYAPWCGHCKALAPEYAIAATELKALGVPLGKLDATVHSKTAGAHSISGYPTLKVFRNGRATDYNGPRKADGIVAYMKKQMGPAAKPITTDAELQALQVQDPSVQYVIVGFFNEGKPSQLASSFSILANRLRDEFLFARTTDVALKQKYKLGAEDERIVAFLYGEQTNYESGSSKTSDVEAFIRQNSLPLVGEFSEQTSAMYASRKLPVAKLFLNVDRKPRSQTMRYYTNRLKKIAQQFAGKILVAYADRTGMKGQLEHLNMQDEEHSFVIDDQAANKLYRFEADEEEEDAGKKKAAKGLDVQGWTHFIEDYLLGEIPAYVKSQRVPKNNLQQAVKVATGSNFEELVEDDEKDVLVEFYAPWCGHCKALEPKYKQLGEKLQADPNAANVIIAKMDATANEWDRTAYEVKGYPTLFFKPAGKAARVYEGAREVDDMYEYIKKNASTMKKKKKKAKKGKKKGKKAKKAAEAEE